MSKIRIGNAPCSWGSLEFEGLASEAIGWQQMLNELSETQYGGTELGDWGYLPTDPVQLHHELAVRQLELLGAFVPVRLADPSCHAQGQQEALKIAHQLAQLYQLGKYEMAPFLVLADDNGADPVRTQRAGRITEQEGFTESQWDTFAQGAQEIARLVKKNTGLLTVFHHHCAGYVETPTEIAHLLKRTDPESLGLVFDTGHFQYGSGDNAPASTFEFLNEYAERIWYIHFKDCHPRIAATARREGWDYFQALRAGVFCELGQGSVDFPGIVRWLQEQNYDRWIVVEQDILPGLGTPKESALRNRQYLQSIGL